VPPRTSRPRKRAPPAAPAASALPWFGTRVFGREADTAAVHALVAGGERMVTLLGPAGVGKTRLAHEVALRCERGRRSPAVWFVELSAATGLPQIARAIERAVDPDGRPGATPAEVLHAVAARLAARGPAVLVLDNCEQAAGELAAACRMLLERGRALRVLATSRIRLRLSFERIYRVEPLAIDGEAAIELIQDRLAMRGHLRARGVADLAILRAIVARLEGMPLALELAAARLGVVSPAALLARLETQLDALTDDPVDREPRQHSLRNAIAASWALLDADQRRALSRLAVFRGGWTLPAATAVLGVGDAGSAEAMLRDFVDRSLVRAVTGGAATRFAMYEGLRQYAAEILGGSGDRAEIERRHADHLIGETRDVADWSRTLDAGRKLAAEAERENLLAAFDHLVRRDLADRAAIDGALVLASILASIDLTHGPWAVAADRLTAALAGSRSTLGSGALVADALCKRAYLLEHLGRTTEARADLARGTAVANAAGAVAIELDLLRTRIHLEVRDGRDGIALARRAAELAETYRDVAERSLACWGLALALHAAGDTAEALAAIDRGLEIEELEVRAPRPAIYLALRGGILHELGRFSEATAMLDEAIELVRARNAPTYVAQFAFARALVEVERGGRGAEAALVDAGKRAATNGDERTAFVATSAAALVAGLLGKAALAADRLAPLRSSRDRLGPEPRALYDLVAAVARAATARGPDQRRARIEAALLGPTCNTPLLRCARRIAAGAVRGSAGADAALRVSRDCSALELRDGTRVELGVRSPARRLLLGLVTRHLRAPGDPSTIAALAAEGWPGERIDPRAAKNRVHVALAELRRAGLRDLVCRSPRGYFLDPTATIAVLDDAG
jgi:predicted ATPase